MAWTYRTGFEHGIDLAEWFDTGPVSQGTTTDNPKSGSYAYRMTMASSDTWEPPRIGIGDRANTTTAKISGIWSVYVDDLFDLDYIRLAVETGATTSPSLLYVGLLPDGSVTVGRTNTITAAGTVLESLPAGTVTSNSWYTVELMGYIDNTAGEYDVAINGASVMSDTGVDTFQGSGTITVDSYLTMRVDTKSGGSAVVDFDDVLGGVDETTLLTTTQGIPVHEALVPTSDVETDGTPSTGTNHWELVDEIPPASGDYNTFTSGGDRERYGLSDRTETGDIIGVGVWATASDPTTADTIRLLVDSNGSEVESVDKVLSDTPGTHHSFLVDDDPDTATDWTTSGVNALTAGARRPA